MQNGRISLPLNLPTFPNFGDHCTFLNSGDHCTLDPKILHPHPMFFDITSIGDVAASRTVLVSSEVSASPQPGMARPATSSLSPARSALFFPSSV
jgi:hypothetical protein